MADKKEHSLAWEMLCDLKNNNRILIISNIILAIALIIAIIL